MDNLLHYLNIINTYADLIMVVIAIITAFVAIGQWKDQREDNRLRIASGLTTWWAKDTTRSQQYWGVILSNTSNLTFYDVKVATSGNFNKHAKPIALEAIPPGHYFIAGKPEHEQFDWDFAKEIKDFYNSPYQAILNSKTHNIHSLTFKDYMNRSWKWTPAHGLVTL